MKKTSQAVTVNFRDYGPITVPAGTPVTSETACGHDPNYNFVNSFGWIDKDYPDMAGILKHDATYHGIDIPKEFVTDI